MNDLTERLAREAEGFDRRGGSPLHIEQVLERAGEIKRGRRLRATLVMAAAVLAIAVPTIVVASGGQRASERPTPAHAVKKDLSPLRLTGLEQGGAPSLGYVVDGVLHQDDASTRLGAPGAVRAVVPLGSRFLVETDTGEGVLRASVVPAPPDFVGQPSSWPVEGGLAASRSGHLAAFVQPDGTPVVVEDDGRVSVDLPRIRQGTGFDVVGVTGTTCKAPSDHVCAVWARTSGRTPESWVSTPEGSSPIPAASGSPDTAEPHTWQLADVLDDGTQAVMTEVTDTGSCSEIRSPDGPAAWSTCEYRFLAFSPDGTHLLASSAYADGAGDNRLVVLGASGGRPALDLRTADGAFIAQMGWEDASHVLATVSDGGRWAVVRIGLDGSREYAVAPVSGKDPYESPFVLPSR